MPILPDQPANTAKILDTSTKLYAASFRKLISLILISAILPAVLSNVLGSTETESGLTHFNDENASFLLTIIELLLLFVVNAAMIYRIDNVAKQRQDSLAEALQVGLNKFPPMLVATILYILAVAGGFLLIIPIWIFFAPTLLMFEEAISMPTVAGGFLLIIPLIIPGLIFSLSLAFYLYFIVLDNLGGYSAITASHNLVWGNWWRTAAVFTVPPIVLMVTYVGLWLVISLLMGIVIGVSGLTPAGTPDSSNIFNIFFAFGNLMIVFMVIVSAIIESYFFTLGYVQYQDLKLRKQDAGRGRHDRLLEQSAAANRTGADAGQDLP